MLSLSEITEKVNDRWEVCVSLSDGQFQQVSFVNSIATIKGGTLTIHPSSFGSKCELPPEFLKKGSGSSLLVYVDALLSLLSVSLFMFYLLNLQWQSLALWIVFFPGPTSSRTRILRKQSICSLL
ncbi:uncharacterized protein LOC133805067 [Humulus lupulus]|uniref:uncharacterized protein LOC133805067 n=1 Tax=Humulus lupulus TaxID=3486 RepID=UPI002B40AEC5|nr:uncharacterized protein LOC133805067 [Humulus lupulus]